MSAPNVFLFYPNIIGYVRIILAILSFYSMRTDPVRTAILYLTSGLLDAFDGYLARAFNQASRFGAMLDQLTDRCAFMALLMSLCHFYPRLTFPFQMVAILDIASHWLHLHATDLTKKTTHKTSTNQILNFYYTSRQFLFFMCLCNEAFYGLLYIRAFWSAPGFLGWLMDIVTTLLMFVSLAKSAISLIHLIEASKEIVEYDASILDKNQ